MTMTKNMRIGVAAAAVALILFAAASGLRYMLVVAPEKQGDVAESPSAAAGDLDAPIASPAQEDGGRGDLGSLDSLQREFMASLMRTDWTDSQGTLVKFAAAEYSLSAPGEEDARAFKISLGPIIVANEGLASIASIEVDGAHHIAVLSHEATLANIGDVTTGGLVSEAGAAREDVLRLSSFSGDLRRFERSDFEVSAADSILTIVGEDEQAMRDAIAAHCYKAYPTATRATWKAVATVDYSVGHFVMFFELDDAPSTTISVLYRPEDASFAVTAGETTRFAMEDDDGSA